MKKQKLFIALLVVMAVSLSLFAQGDKETKKSKDDNTIYLVGSVRRYPGEEEAWNSVIKKFEAEYPDIKVVTRWQGQWNEVPQNLAAAKMSGEEVDLFTAGGGVINQALAPSGSLMDMTDIMAPYLDRFEEGMLGSFYIGDKLWGIPHGDFSGSAIYYNVEMFEELGLETPSTYLELVEISKIIRDKKNIPPMLQQGKAAYFWPMWLMETYAQTSGNNSIEYVNQFLAGKRSFVNAEEQNAFAQLKRFFDDNILSAESFDLSGDGVRAAFAQGKTAMFYGGTWEYAPALSTVGDNFEIGIFEFPDLGVGSKPMHGGGASDALVIPSFAQKHKVPQTMKFVEFILRPEYANEIISTYAPIITVIKGVEPIESPIANTLNTEIAPNSITFLDWIWPSEVNNAVIQAIPAVLANQITTKEACEMVQKALDTVIEETDYKADWYNDWTQEQWDAVTP